MSSKTGNQVGTALKVIAVLFAVGLMLRIIGII